ncbi:tRNA pseudouridine synthase D family protein [Cryptosporidium andersoni]|uniref:tRNA pseudouridine synthase D family protein n=1 Tax=Cryptosporidium andersoni TaxID=117008 RepID=A0A1J4MTZ8_9CRYT|nr:tRNA pseudouridine synthase D family protein [Cryptosporidium andersoni]
MSHIEDRKDDYGIHEYIRDTKTSIKGNIKRYFEDFHVYEMTLNNEICHLTEIWDKHKILENFKQQNKILSGEGILDGLSFELSDDLYNIMEEIGITKRSIKCIITFINLLGLIKELIKNDDITPKLLKLDSKGKLASICQVIVQMKCDHIQTSHIKKEISNVLLHNDTNKDKNYIRNTIQQYDNAKERRRKFHHLIKKEFPFLTSQTIETSTIQILKDTKLANINQLDEEISFLLREFDIYLSMDISHELRPFINSEKFYTRLHDEQIGDNSSITANHDYFILRPSNHYVYSLRDLNLKDKTLQESDIISNNNNLDTLEININKRRRRDSYIAKMFSRKNSDERWDNSVPDYIHFNIYKENRDTMDVINMLCKCLQRSDQSFGIAGLKDRRGITIQRASAYRVTKEQIINATLSKAWDRNVRICSIIPSCKPIKIGDLDGNLFHVVIRNLFLVNNLSEKVEIEGNLDESKCTKLTFNTIKMLVDSIKSQGFINYYGLQRFGTSKIPTYKVGIELVKKNWEGAFQLILGYDFHNKQASNGDNVESIEIIEYIKRGDFRKYLELASSHLYIERNLVLNLQREIKKQGEKNGNKALVNNNLDISPNIYKRCLDHIPKGSYWLYIHSLQSLIFNIVASERIRKFGKKPVVGDLVISKSNDSVQSEDNMDISINSKYTNHSIIAIEHEIDLSKYNIEDIVLSLPGDEVIYPPNLFEFYIEVWQKYTGMSIEKDNIGLPGSYRNLVVIPKHADFIAIEKIPNNEDPKSDFFVESKLLKSDLDILLDNREYQSCSEYNRIHPICQSGINVITSDVGESNITAAIFTCILPKSSYVTMALRELLGCMPIENK